MSRSLANAWWGLGLLGLLAGCAALPPPGTAELEFPPVGTRWVSRTVDNEGASSTATWTVLEDGVYEGRPIHRVTDTRDIRLYDKATGNWVATLRDGQARWVAAPHDGTFSWPLRVGRSWVASIALHDRERGLSSSSIVTFWHVDKYEQVQVPAGVFVAFKLEGSPGINNLTYTTLWYAPELRLIVKQVRERTDEVTGRLRRFTTELVEHHPAP